MDGINHIMYKKRALDDDRTQTGPLVLQVCTSGPYGRG